ncbi:MAG: HPr kinase/phosphorylase, partial [Balneolaceae bacterium]|nr:HPr kinase/phosphorylase [Balneolaceae bacterium]
MPFGDLEPIPRKEKINVAHLVKKLQERVNIELRPLTGEEYTENRYVTEADLHRPGLALAGYVKLFTYQRIQVIGNTESQYLENMPEE